MTVLAAGDPRAIPKTLKLYAFAGFMVIALIMPFVLDGYTTYRLAMALAMAMAILGVNLLTGLSGQFSIGHGAFFAIGAYTTAISMNHLGLSAYTAIPLAAVISFIAGFLFGWPALRLNLIHLMLMTWGLSLVLPQILKLEEFQDWTGGVSGVYLDRPDPPDWTHLTDDQYWYFVALIILVIFFWLAGNLGNSRSGRALAAIRDNQIAAAPMGINVALFKTQIFGVSAMYAGIGGAVTGLLTDFVAPDSYGLFFSITLLVGAVMAGFRSVWGALLGALIVLFLPGATGALPASLAVPPFGFMVLAIIFFMPDGISGLALRTYRRYANGKKGR
ncbi:MAG: branched-chain amino acid ABC transporter permease [Rhodospirillaceae bacterium]|nr:branched-chain amino acid ABC transporter permease [Rhodospirillaceae bacterium]